MSPTDPPSPVRSLPPAALAALSRRNKIEAIKIVRQEWRLGLKEAKDAVDAYERGTSPASSAARAPRAGGPREVGGISVRWLLIALAAIALIYFWLGRR